MNIIRLVLEGGQLDVITEESTVNIQQQLNGTSDNILLTAKVTSEDGVIVDGLCGFPRRRLILWSVSKYRPAKESQIVGAQRGLH